MSAEDLKAKGNQAFTKGDFAEAVKFFSEAINLDPKNHILYSNRSGAFAGQKKYQEALDDADKTIEIKPDWAKGYSRKVTALQFLGRNDEAEKVCDQGLAIEPSNAQLKSSKEEIKKSKAGPQSRNPNDMLANMFKGDVLAKLAANPQTSAYVRQPDFVQMIAHLQRDSSALNQYMQDPRMMNSIGVLLGIPMNAMSGDQFKEEQDIPMSSPPAEKKEEKKEEPKKEEKKDEPMPDAEPVSEEKKQAEEEKAKGNAAYSKKEFDAAIGHYSKAIELDPQSVVYYTNRAAAQYEKGDYDACIKDCETAVEEGRKQRVDYKQIAKALTRIGNAYLKKDNLDEAIRYYESSLTEDRNAPTLALLRKAEKTKEERDRVAYIDPAKAQEAKERGNKFFQDASYPDAIKEYSEAMKRNPEDHTLYSNRAACYTKLGEYTLGLKDADKCIEMKPDFAKGYSRKGHLHFFMKEYEKAMKAYDKGLELDPNNAEMTEGVKRTINAMTEQSRRAQQGSGPDEETLKRAAQDPEIQSILTDPVMNQILQDMQNDPQAAASHMKNPLVASKIQKLINAGIVRTK